MQLVVVVEDLDRVLDRDDVLPARAVDVADHRGERRRLAGAGRARDEDQPAVLLGEPLDAGRQAEALEVGHVARDHAEGERDLAALAERVHAEARQAVRLVGGVELARLVEGGEARRRRGADLVDDVLELGRAERREALSGSSCAVEADDRRLADLQMQVARAALDCAARTAC